MNNLGKSRSISFFVARHSWNGAISVKALSTISPWHTGVRPMLGNYLQRAIDVIRVARSELPMLAEAGVRDRYRAAGLEALLDALQHVDRRLSSLEEKVGVEEESTTRHH